MEHRGTVRLETERLALRPFSVEDAEAMYRNWASDPLVTKFLRWPPHRSAEQTAWLLEQWARQSEDPRFYQWAMVLKELGEPVGSISVVRTDPEAPTAELGYCIGRTWWGRGLTPEAVRAVSRYLIREVGFHRVCACHDVNNPASGRVMEKSGMTREGTLRQAQRNNQGLVDVTYYSILAGELPEK